MRPNRSYLTGGIWNNPGTHFKIPGAEGGQGWPPMAMHGRSLSFNPPLPESGNPAAMSSVASCSSQGVTLHLCIRAYSDLATDPNLDCLSGELCLFILPGTGDTEEWPQKTRSGLQRAVPKCERAGEPRSRQGPSTVWKRGDGFNVVKVK